MINKKLFDNESAIFMGAKRNPDDCSIGIFGVNYDGTCSYKSGTRFGPNAIRLVLSLIHISEPTRQRVISYAVFCLKKFFFNDTATTEIYTIDVVGSVRCV